MLSKPYPRLWSLEAGTAMVVTDLHGDWESYARYRDRFVDLEARGRVDYLIFTGDLIHSDGPAETDKSLDIVLDIEALRARYGQAVIQLCGNHELPHIYGSSMAKGEKLYTPAFEAALDSGSCREQVISRFEALPFYLRTRAGVALTHAGAAAPLAAPGNAQKIFNWSHRRLLDWAEDMINREGAESLRNGYARLRQVSYAALASYYLAVSGPEDPRYNDLLKGFLTSNRPDFEQLLWPALFTRCEREYGAADYGIFLEALLRELASDFYPQQILAAGHIPVKGGYEIVARRHLRLASGPHATPRKAGRYLLFDAARPISTVEALLRGALDSVYE